MKKAEKVTEKVTGRAPRVATITTSTSVTLMSYEGGDGLTVAHLRDLLDTSLRHGAPPDASVSPYSNPYSQGCSVTVRWSPAANE